VADQAALFAPAPPPRALGAFVGLDPGLGGAVAAILTDGSVRLWRTPTRMVPGPDGEDRRDYDERAMARLLFALPRVELVLIEKQQAYPDAPVCPRCSCVPCRARKGRGRGGQGVVSAFTTGAGWGLWRMALTSAELPWEAVAPQAWKRAMGVLPPSPPRRKKGERPPPEPTPAEARARAEERRALAKRLAIERARALFPGVRLVPPGGRVESPDLAEALLLAALARQRSEAPA
jgi:hypothetical protein